eukprot:TRINITY_DN33388_c0_g1_i1.p1 TRINITY_DN33388_c0_g1~~TRINITY_DN33388_c0_g1_i1.p1  ORF type:complete len:423 (+),score=61.41 TRINITY_DN33388_c0_g1_i1:396-1664(+)
MRWGFCKSKRSRVRSKSPESVIAIRAATQEHLEHFPRLRVVNHHTWLYHNKEEGQSVQDFIDRPDRNVPDAVRKVIYLQPFGEITMDEQALLPIIQQYVRAFFQLEVRVRPPRSLASMPAQLTTRELPPGNTQYFTRPIFTALRKLLPADAFCVEGITVCDLFSRHGRSFVFGSAKLSGRVGVYSFHRHRPSFYDQSDHKSSASADSDTDESESTDEEAYRSRKKGKNAKKGSRYPGHAASDSDSDSSGTSSSDGGEDSDDSESSSSSQQGDGQRRSKGLNKNRRKNDGMSASDRDILIKRAIKTCVHEISHMFFMKHCVYYNCAMNGSIDIVESDLRSAHLCPVCLEKLQSATKCNVLTRYQDLEAVYLSLDMLEEAQFVQKRQRVIQRALTRDLGSGKSKKSSKSGHRKRGWFRFGKEKY